MTWKWVSRWGMMFWLLWEFSAAWESSAVHRQVVPSCRDVPLCRRIRFDGSLPAETGLSASELDNFGVLWAQDGECPLQWWCGLWQPRLLAWGTSGGMEAEQSHRREPLDQRGLWGSAFSRVCSNVSSCSWAQNQRQTHALKTPHNSLLIWARFWESSQNVFGALCCNPAQPPGSLFQRAAESPGLLPHCPTSYLGRQAQQNTEINCNLLYKNRVAGETSLERKWETWKVRQNTPGEEMMREHPGVCVCVV